MNGLRRSFFLAILLLSFQYFLGQDSLPAAQLYQIGTEKYNAGTYNDAVIYFTRAINSLKSKDKSTIALMAEYKNKLGSTLRKLHLNDSALAVFNDLLRYNVNRNQILYNIGSIYLDKNEDSLAAVYLQRSSYNSQQRLNELGVAFLRLDEGDSALMYFRNAAALNEVLNGNKKNFQFAITCLLLGDYHRSIDNYDSAIISYHQAINHLVDEFNAEDARMNPIAFDGKYELPELFKALGSKAQTFTTRYQKQHNKNDLLSSIYAYESLYKLCTHAVRTYPVDQLEVLIPIRSHSLHHEPIDNAIALFKITGDDIYQRHAFRFDEKSKALINCIERLQKGIEVNRLQTKMIDSTIGVASLQEAMHKKNAMISYHASDTNLHSFLITKDRFVHHAQQVDSHFIKMINEFEAVVWATDTTATKQAAKLSDTLYEILISPLAKDFQVAEQLMIIHDGKVSELPFEQLSADGQKKLGETFAIAYSPSYALVKRALAGSTDYGNVSIGRWLMVAPLVLAGIMIAIFLYRRRSAA